MFALVLIFMVVEVVAGIVTGSLALLSEAGHMATDALGLGMALAAVTAAGRTRRTASRKLGLYHLEILAALANAVLLLGVAGYVIYEGVVRFQDPSEIASGWMLVVAVVGLLVNLLGWWLLRPGADTSISIEGAMLEVLADPWGSVGVIAAAVVVRLTGWLYADLLIGVAIGLFILPRAYRLARRAGRILVQAAPEGLDMSRLREELLSLEGVVDVHDLQVWTLTFGHGGGVGSCDDPEGRIPIRCWTERGSCCATCTASSTQPSRWNRTRTGDARDRLVRTPGPPARDHRPCRISLPPPRWTEKHRKEQA